MKHLSLSTQPVREVGMRRMNGRAGSQARDFLAAEEPLEIRVEGHSVAIVMRTPGEDRELAAGFLVTEGLLHSSGDLVDIQYEPHCMFSALNGGVRRPDDSHKETPQATENLPDSNVINVRLKDPETIDFRKLTRHVFTSSSCGICSKSSIEAVRQQFPPIEDDFEVDPQLLFRLPAALSSAQETFKRTGGLHACALFDSAGNLLAVREDVGRHNALDKVIGWALLEGRLPLRRHILLLSGRTSFEMMQKALAAGIPIIAAISAPSSLAAEFAHNSGQTLVGFLRGEKMNIYSGAGRLNPLEPSRRRSPTTVI